MTQITVSLFSCGDIKPSPGYAILCKHQQILPFETCVTLLPMPSYSYCFNHTLSTLVKILFGINLPYNILSKLLWEEGKINETIFMIGIVKTYPTQFCSQFDLKIYNSDLGDFLPLLACNALTLYLLICSSPNFSITNCTVVYIKKYCSNDFMP